MIFNQITVIIATLSEKVLRNNEIIKSFILTSYTELSVHCKDIKNITVCNYKLAYSYKKIDENIMF